MVLGCPAVRAETTAVTDESRNVKSVKRGRSGHGRQRNAKAAIHPLPLADGYPAASLTHALPPTHTLALSLSSSPPTADTVSFLLFIWYVRCLAAVQPDRVCRQAEGATVVSLLLVRLSNDFSLDRLLVLGDESSLAALMVA